MKMLKFLTAGILLMVLVNCSNIPIIEENFDFGSIAGSNNFKPFVDGFEGSKQVFTKSSNKWVSLYYNWETDKSEIERNVYVTDQSNEINAIVYQILLAKQLIYARVHYGQNIYLFHC